MSFRCQGCTLAIAAKPQRIVTKIRKRSGRTEIAEEKNLCSSCAEKVKSPEILVVGEEKVVATSAPSGTTAMEAAFNKAKS